MKEREGMNEEKEQTNTTEDITTYGPKQGRRQEGGKTIAGSYQQCGGERPLDWSYEA
jgi:hypothetical protein